MAKHFSEVKRELEQPDGHMAGIGQQLKLSEEARMPEMPDEGLRTRTTRPTSSEPRRS